MDYNEHAKWKRKNVVLLMRQRNKRMHVCHINTLKQAKYNGVDF